MRDNINKVSERGARLDSLQDKTDNLAVSAQGFRRGANRVRKQMWWKDMKMRMCLIVGIIILLVIIIVPSGESPTWFQLLTTVANAMQLSLRRRTKRYHAQYHETYPLIIARGWSCIARKGEGVVATNDAVQRHCLSGSLSTANLQAMARSFLVFLCIRTVGLRQQRAALHPVHWNRLPLTRYLGA